MIVTPTRTALEISDVEATTAKGWDLKTPTTAATGKVENVFQSYKLEKLRESCGCCFNSGKVPPILRTFLLLPP